jgi:fido (protein-threonine AMPylation protein)
MAWQQMPSVIPYIFRFMALIVVSTAVLFILDGGRVAKQMARVHIEIGLTALAEGGIAAARVATEDVERARRATVKNVSVEVGGGDYGMYILWLASLEADAWRAGVVKELYAGMTDADWQTAARWIAFAYPFATNRSCRTLPPSGHEVLRTVPAFKAATLSPAQHRQMTGEHVFNSAGIDGNTLAPSWTQQIIEGTLDNLLSPRQAPNREGIRDPYIHESYGRSVTEIRNLQTAFEAVQLMRVPRAQPGPFRLSRALLDDIHSLVVGNLTDPPRHTWSEVSERIPIEYQHVLFPMPAELPSLIDQFVRWVSDRVEHIAADDPRDVISAACDVHTTLVHIRPYAVGNGRIARMLSGTLLQHYGLPPALLLKRERTKYMIAVSDATIRGNYTAICSIFEAGVVRAIGRFHMIINPASWSDHWDPVLG